jgi:hypothetical protein
MLYLRLSLVVVFIGVTTFAVIMRFWKGRGEPVNSEYVKALRPIAAVWIVSAILYTLALVLTSPNSKNYAAWCAMNVCVAAWVTTFPFSRKALRFMLYSLACISVLFVLVKLQLLIATDINPESFDDISVVITTIALATYGFMALVAAPSFLKPKAKAAEPKA